MNMVYRLLIGFLILFLFVPSVFAKEQRVYDLTLKYDEGIITKQSLIVTIGVFNEVKDQSENSYRLELLSLDNKIHYAHNFSFDLVADFSPPPPGTFDEKGRQISIPRENTIIFDEAEKELIFPFFPDGKEIEIYDPENKKILTISVAHFAEITPTPISPTPPIIVTKLEKGIGAPWIIGGGILLFAITIVGVFIYLRFKKPQ